MGRVEDCGIHFYEVEVESEAEIEKTKAHSWKAGFKYRFPYISLAALLLIIGIIAGIIAVVVDSDKKDVKDWNQHTVTIGGWTHTTSIPVNVWISGFVFFAGKLVAIMFAEAVTLAWWVKAMKGRTIRQLTHDFDAGQSITAVLKNPKLFSWICLGSIAFTVFSGLGMIIQKSTAIQTVEMKLNHVHMATEHLERLPYGWSGLSGDDDIGQWSNELSAIINEYQKNAPIDLGVKNCPDSSDSICSTVYRGVGFEYNCSASRGYLETSYQKGKDGTNIAPVVLLWKVAFGWMYNPVPPLGHSIDPEFGLPQKGVSHNPYKIQLQALWKDLEGPVGEKLLVQSCVLTPAIVEYPITVTQGQAELLAPTSEVHWYTEHPDVSSTPTDKVVRILAENQTVFHIEAAQTSGTRITYGGLFQAFQSLYGSNIRYRDNGPQHSFFEASSAFAMKYLSASKLVGSAGVYPWNAVNQTFASPMPDITESIRQIMFRSSVYLLNNKVEDWNTTKTPPVAEYTDTEGSLKTFHTVYESNYAYLGVGIGLMLLSIAIILPLFWGFWRLGRKVSLSPLELATALNSSALQEKGQKHTEMDANVYGRLEAIDGGYVLSNANADELVNKMGHIKVKYGEVNRNTLGLGVADSVVAPHEGAIYK